MQKSQFLGIFQRTIKTLSRNRGKKFKGWFWLQCHPH